jgi:hypothetical protein
MAICVCTETDERQFLGRSALCDEAIPGVMSESGIPTSGWCRELENRVYVEKAAY